MEINVLTVRKGWDPKIKVPASLIPGEAFLLPYTSLPCHCSLTWPFLLALMSLLSLSSFYENTSSIELGPILFEFLFCFLIFLITFYWSRVTLQCCVCFY
ncbi:unnamed protein product [Rangifer tarandus platyrhynchus]|uniref:Uncharacterized protein n=1 Tax=Rangifer tarandus platyrhynchus TaxID=3082113 RepID=A0AC59YL62_RANTA